MKKVLISFLILILCLTGCKQKEKIPVETLVIPEATEESNLELEVPIYPVIYEVNSLEENEKYLKENKRLLDEANKISDAYKELGFLPDHPSVIAMVKIISNLEDNINYYEKTIYDLGERQKAYPEAEIIWDYLHDYGYNDYVIAGILGNIMVEVGGGTLNIDEYCYYNGNGYYGICQWSKKYYPEISGADIINQCKFLTDTIQAEYYEYGGLGGYSYSEFIELTNEREAAISFAKTYERCGSGSYSNRQSCASAALEYFK